MATACAEIRNSGTFKELMSCIMQVGKFLNSQKDFLGFDISPACLKYIMDFKDKTEESASIGLHSLNLLQQENPSKNHAKSLKLEIKTVFELGKPNTLKASDVQNDLMKWNRQTKNITENIGTININSHSVTSTKILENAIGVIAKTLSIIQETSEKVANVFFETMIYMGLNPIKYEIEKPEKPKSPSSDLFSPISDFVQHVLKEKEKQVKEQKVVAERKLKTKRKIVRIKVGQKENKSFFKSRKSGVWLKSKKTQFGVLDEVVSFNMFNLRHIENTGDVETDGGPSESQDSRRRYVRRVKMIKKTMQFTYFRESGWVRITRQFSYYRILFGI